MNNILITICARGGSKGIPGKNIKLIHGKPLIAYSIETAHKFSKLHNVQVGLSTDSFERMIYCSLIIKPERKTIQDLSNA